LISGVRLLAAFGPQALQARQANALVHSIMALLDMLGNDSCMSFILFGRNAGADSILSLYFFFSRSILLEISQELPTYQRVHLKNLPAQLASLFS
jgi:hypothetical protein